MRIFLIIILTTSSFSFLAQNTNTNKFKQLKEEMATPNVYRTAAGAPGHKYYQNNANYKMDIILNDYEHKLTGTETITYINNSPDKLEYLWLQLDQNRKQADSDSKLIATGGINSVVTNSIIDKYSDYDGGFKITSVTDVDSQDLSYTINKTMMRINLDKPLQAGEKFVFTINWWWIVNNRMEVGGRSGYEYFEKDDNNLYTIAQFFPRMCMYSDVEGWQNKQFLGHGEFTLPFGNYEVNISTSTDMTVTATGVLQNLNDVLTTEQIDRLAQARKSDTQPVFIITEDEAIKKEKLRRKGLKTWRFKAENVRDFAFASSRKFIWDAMIVHQNDKDVLAMSFYPKEGNPLWEQYSTKAVAQTLKTYSKHTFDYPYPVAISVHSKSIGMEYPMISFNGGRPEQDGTYSKRTKYSMISVIIHEVGHNYFPMIINSDERQWTWMDEGLNTFLQYLTEKEWDINYPSRRGPAYKIVNYMKGDKNYISPIMTNSESLHQFGNNAYGKPATALNILRETIMGRDLFDYAFKTYANRWMFKHPTPADFFRTMEDASAVDLDWFWRGWFYTTNHVDISLEQVNYYKLDSKNPSINKTSQKDKFEEINNNDITNQRNKDKKTYVEIDESLNDFYNSYSKYDVSNKNKKEYEAFLKRLDDDEKKALDSDKNLYEIKFKNIGGLVMPIILEFTFKDGSSKLIRIPAEIWKMNNYSIKKVFIFEKQVTKIRLDPYLETADTDINNNSWPKQYQPSLYELYKFKYSDEKSHNAMKK